MVFNIWLLLSCIFLENGVTHLLHFLLCLTWDLGPGRASHLLVLKCYTLPWCFTAFKELLHKNDLVGSSECEVGRMEGNSVTISHRRKEEQTTSHVTWPRSLCTSVMEVDSNRGISLFSLFHSISSHQAASEGQVPASP